MSPCDATTTRRMSNNFAFTRHIGEYIRNFCQTWMNFRVTYTPNNWTWSTLSKDVGHWDYVSALFWIFAKYILFQRKVIKGIRTFYNVNEDPKCTAAENNYIIQNLRLSNILFREVCECLVFAVGGILKLLCYGMVCYTWPLNKEGTVTHTIDLKVYGSYMNFNTISIKFSAYKPQTYVRVVEKGWSPCLFLSLKVEMSLKLRDFFNNVTMVKHTVISMQVLNLCIYPQISIL